MTPAQKETFLIIDEYWKNYGYGPTIDDIMRMTGEKSRSNVSRKMKVFIEIGVCKQVHVGTTKESSAGAVHPPAPGQ